MVSLFAVWVSKGVWSKSCNLHWTKNHSGLPFFCYSDNFVYIGILKHVMCHQSKSKSTLVVNNVVFYIPYFNIQHSNAITGSWWVLVGKLFHGRHVNNVSLYTVSCEPCLTTVNYCTLMCAIPHILLYTESSITVLYNDWCEHDDMTWFCIKMMMNLLTERATSDWCCYGCNGVNIGTISIAKKKSSLLVTEGCCTYSVICLYELPLQIYHL